MTYDPETGSAVLIGGVTDTSGDTLSGETWHYHNGWTEATPATTLPARAYHRAVYDGTAIILYSDGEVWKYE